MVPVYQLHALTVLLTHLGDLEMSMLSVFSGEHNSLLDSHCPLGDLGNVL